MNIAIFTILGFLPFFEPQYTKSEALALCQREAGVYRSNFPKGEFFCYDHRYPCSNQHTVELVAVWKEGDVVNGGGERSVPKKWKYKESKKTQCI